MNELFHLKVRASYRVFHSYRLYDPVLLQPATFADLSSPNSFLAPLKSVRVIGGVPINWHLHVKITGHWTPVFLSFALKKGTAKQAYRTTPKNVKNDSKRWVGGISIYGATKV